MTVRSLRASAGGGRSPASLLLERLAAVQWASRELDHELRAVYLVPEGAWVTVGDARSNARFGPIAYGANDVEVEEGLVRPAGLVSPRPGPAVPVYPEPGAAWRHYWAELLQDLGVHDYALRDSGSSRRYDSMELDEANLATITVVDDAHSRWITRLALDPPRTDMLSVPFDISYWIGMGQGSTVGENTKVFDLLA